MTDFEFRVWTTFLLCADDYGVMRFSVSALRAANDALEARSAAALERAFQRVADVRLVHAFDHQGKRYVYQRDWQDWQGVRHPRQTVNPMPPADHLRLCSRLQRELFQRHPAIVSEELPQSSGEVPETFPPLAYAGTGDPANGERLTAHGSVLQSFERFWLAYPKKKAKPAAQRLWQKLEPDPPLVERILAAVHEQCRSADWLKDGGQFIPHPATWLSQARWLDEATELPQISDQTARTLEAIYGK